MHDVIYRNINVEYEDVIQPMKIQNNDKEVYFNDCLDYVPNLISVTTDYHHEYSAGGTRRGKTRNLRFENINILGKGEPKLYFKGYDSEHQTKDIVIKNIYHNGKLIKEIKKENFVMEKFTENIVYIAEDDFSQMKKNNVDSHGQLKENGEVRFYNLNSNGKRIMFVGNSMTLHGVLDSIGWHRECGMAASSIENDYVHVLMNKIGEKSENSQFCICQVSEWERLYKNGESTFDLYENARNFDADIIVMRFVENCPSADFEPETFKTQMDKLLCYLNKSGNAKFVLTTGFWRHPADNTIIDYAKEKNLPCVLLGDLGELDEMKAIGLFEHGGVANHPGDLGMKNIAERIFTELEKIL